MANARDARAAQRRRMLRAKVALALYSAYGRVPKEEEIDHLDHLLSLVLFKATRGTHFLRSRQKQGG